MTPHETYAQKRREALALIRAHAPARLQESLIALLRPAIALNATRADDSAIPLGASKFGGAPDVPEGFVWPSWNDKPLGFLAQINLEEVAPFDIEELLPKSGIMAFFCCFDEQNPVWGEYDQRDGWRVFFYALENLQRVEAPKDSHWIVPLHTQRIAAAPTWSLSDQEEEWLDMEWEEEEWNDFKWEFVEQMKHQILGGPRAPQLSPFTIAVNGSLGRNGFQLYEDYESTFVAAKNWKLLLQIDTEANGFFDDIYGMGWFYFLIHKDDLAMRDFSKVWFNEQGT